MNSILPVILVASLITFAAAANGCAPSHREPATIELTGTSGARITGYLVRDGKRVPLDAQIPATIQEPGITMIAFKKNNPQDAVNINVHDNGNQAGSGSPAGSADGIRIELGDGPSVSIIKPGELLDLPASAAHAGDGRLTINPYWSDGTWVFDDASTGLVREPFVQGVPEMIDDLVKNVPNARSGFKLTASGKPFPGYQKKYVWERPEAGGNYYKDPASGKEGWLCPALFRYFAEAPKELYVKAEAKGG